MKHRASAVIFNENSVIQNKIPDAKVLLFALNLGMLSPIDYNALIAIGQSKQVGELMKDLSFPNLDVTKALLRGLLRRGLVVVAG